METQSEHSAPNAKALPETRQAEVEYHKKLNIYVAFGAAPIFLATGIFYYTTHNYLLTILFSLMVINEATGVILAFKIKKVRNLVRLKLVTSAIAFGLLQAAMIVGIRSGEVYSVFPWIFLVPFIMLLFFGPRIGLYGALGFSLVIMAMLLKLDLPAWRPYSVTVFKINAMAALTAFLIFGWIAQNLRQRTQKALLSARNRAQAAEQAQRKSHHELAHVVALKQQSEKERSRNEIRYRHLFEESSVAMCEEDWSGLKAFLDALPKSADGDFRTCLRNNPLFLEAYPHMIRLTAANRAMLKLYETDTTESLLRNMARILPPDSDGYHVDRIASLYMDGRFDAVTTAHSLGGRHLDLLVRITIPSGFSDSWQKVYTSAHDITDQVAMEHFNKRVANQLIQSQRVQAVAALAGGMAHQFNNGLSAIQNNLDLIKFYTNTDPSSQQHLTALQTTVYRMGHLTDQLLAYAQGVKYQPMGFCPNHLIKEIIESGSLASYPQMKFQTHLSPDMCECLGDLIQMKMVMEAILINACESMPNGGHLAIRTHNQIIRQTLPNGHTKAHPTADLKTYAVLCVEDTGEGMDSNTCQRIFEPFFTTKFFGRGMGMATAYGIVRNHGGFINVSSTPGRGTKASVFLPCHHAKKA